MLKKIIQLLSKEKFSDNKINESKEITQSLAEEKKVVHTAEALKNAGDQSLKANNLEQAELYYRQSLEADPTQPAVYKSWGVALYYLKRLDEALISYDRAIALQPDFAEAYSNRGLALNDLERLNEALTSYDHAIALKPDFVGAFYNRGIVLGGLNRLDEALTSYDRAIALNPDYASAYNNRGLTLYCLKRLDEALTSYDRAIALKPDHASAYNNKGRILIDLKRLDEALISYDRAIALKPDYAEAYNNRGVVLKNLNRLDEALTSYDRAIALKPDYAEAYYNSGLTLDSLMRLDEALASYDRAIALKPDYAEAYYNSGLTLDSLMRLDEALTNYGHAHTLKPDHELWYGDWLLTKMMLCDWRNYDDQMIQLADKIEHEENASSPFVTLVLSSSRALQKKSAEIYVRNKWTVEDVLHKITKHLKHDKIRIGYFSADLHNHATTYLMAELFEQHDKSKFEIIAFSFGPNVKDGMRTRVIKAFNQFIDVRHKSDQEVAMLARNLEIDIAIDLKGFTQDCRPGIFALRAAPLQINYLGYPGTMGAEYIDYLIADTTLIPKLHQNDYSEKIVYLPDSYQINDTNRLISDKVFTRKELGLPSTGFIFCCFNNNYKITPSTFDSWMRILKQVAGSVLWLLEGSETAANNLTKEATLRGVDSKRLIFAKRLPLPEHLARHRLADLFLDTLPCNAHTTTSDSLWAGLPVLTCLGETFAGRVAASLLNAIHLPELITTTQKEYETLAVTLATHPNKLMRIKQKLADNRLTTHLFDTQLFTQHIEAAYTQVYQRYQADLMPDHIYL